MIIYTKEQTAQVENAAMNAGISQQRLMENAGSAVAKVIRDNYGCQSLHVCIICGSGNNGGDGFVTARRMAKDGAAVTVILFSGEPKGGAAANVYSFVTEMGLTVVDAQTDFERCVSLLSDADVIVDAAYGFGFHGRMPETLANLCDTVNRLDTPVVAVDIPSGVECDTGIADPHTIRADITVTFISHKVCHMIYSSAGYCGKVVLTDIGVPKSCYVRSRFGVIGREYVFGALPDRPDDGHKGTFGTVYTVCGSYGMCGAAEISATAAMKSGAGLVKMAVSDSVYGILGAKLTEPVFDICDSGKNLTADSADHICSSSAKADSILFGCGCTDSDDTKKLLSALISSSRIPMVIDAGGINSLAVNIDELRNADCEIVLTPHMGEMARLCGVTVGEIMSNRIGYGEYIAVTYGVVLVLKDANTMVFSPDGCIYFNTIGNSGMATAGSGDMLAGIIASLLAQGMSADDAARAGVYIHALSGDIAAERFGKRSMTATDMLSCLHNAFLELDSGRVN